MDTTSKISDAPLLLVAHCSYAPAVLIGSQPDLTAPTGTGLHPAGAEHEQEKTGLHKPTSLAFSLRANGLYVAEATAGSSTAQTTDIVKLNRFAHRAGLARAAAAIKDPFNMIHDAKQARVLILNAAAHQLPELREDASGNLVASSRRHCDVRSFGLQTAGRMSTDPASGRLFILDQAGRRIVSVEPGRWSPPSICERVGWVSCAAWPSTRARAICRWWAATSTSCMS